ncbi:MAG: type IV pili twitching motility protein PilT [Halobacteriovoraceae bacterium]|nr:type IV pili twitching motility protein PilT [Halobacteriovoraceae bacterium]|tara:strand:+ start:4271 stop:5383 length:1113 start_codon:yes stop_codon:yes gene_type:complete
MPIAKEDFLKLVKTAVSNGVSDIHIRTNERPCFRIRGDLVPVKTDVFSYDDVKACAEIMVKNPKIKTELDTLKELDGSFQIPKLCRLRYNLLRYQNKMGIILRIIDADIPTTEALGLPAVVNKIALAHNGLVLVTGATGSGKSSTLAAMINHINKTKPVHILTLEDPVEYIHVPQKARITQREIGEDTEDFGSALRSALRQDPDIILIGEMRDSETIGIALKAAETGHLVFGTVHTTDALNTIGRLISMFPPEEQDAVRNRISDNLYATISQRLVKTVDGKGRVAAQEIMITSPGIRESISDANKIAEIYTYIRKGKRGSGTQTFDQHLTDLYKAGKITKEEAKNNASSPEDFERNLMFGDEENDESGLY